MSTEDKIFNQFKKEKENTAIDDYMTFDEWLEYKVINLQSKCKELEEENKGLKVQSRALQDAVNESTEQLEKERDEKKDLKAMIEYMKPTFNYLRDIEGTKTQNQND